MLRKNHRKPQLNCDDVYKNGDLYDQFMEQVFWNQTTPGQESSSGYVPSESREEDESRLDEAATGTINSEHNFIDPVEYQESITIATSIHEVFEDIPFDDITVNNDLTDAVELEFDEVIIDNTSALSQLNSLDEKFSVVSPKEGYDSDFDDDWDILTAMQNLMNGGSLCTKNDSDWDAVSSVPSVISRDTFQSKVRQLTYKDIVAKRSCVIGNRRGREAAAMNDPSQVVKEDVTLSQELMVPTISHEYCDAYHELEGYKYARGGKRALLFRGNQKQKSRNYRKTR
jgi:hypothetical protein